MKVAICICTYRRPKGLARLLQGLSRLCFRKVSAPAVELVIVDNTAEGMMRDFCEKAQRDYRWPIRYEIEPCRGISYARNRAIQSVREGTDFVAFIDDDEVPEPSWLDELLYVQGVYHADVVTGPAYGRFEQAVPSWIISGKFFNKIQGFSPGEILSVAHTYNVLVKFRIFREEKILFDEKFALTGGEDTFFFKSLSLRGYKIVWAERAIVFEWIPESRANLKWILKRSYRHGIQSVRVDLALRKSIVKALLYAMGIIRWILWGLLLLPLSLVGGRVLLVSGLKYIMHGIGRTAGFLGVIYYEYHATHGE